MRRRSKSWSIQHKARAALGHIFGAAGFRTLPGERGGEQHNMPSKMLIDAAHPEETRVVVVKGNRVEEFDYEFSQQEAATRQYLSCQGDAR